MSAVFNGGMAVVEAVAIAYVFNAWHHAGGQEAKRLLVLIALMLITFSMVLAPFVASSVGNVAIKELLENAGQYSMTLVWGTAVVLSTSFTVMAVGVAQGTGNGSSETKQLCWCGKEMHDQSEHIAEIAEFDSSFDAMKYLEQKYGGNRNAILMPIPNVVEIARMKHENIRTDSSK